MEDRGGRFLVFTIFVRGAVGRSVSGPERREGMVSVGALGRKHAGLGYDETAGRFDSAGRAGKRERRECWTEVVRVRATVSRRSDAVCSAAERVR